MEKVRAAGDGSASCPPRLSEKMTNLEASQLMTCADAAKVLAVTARTVQRLSDSGRLKTLRTSVGYRLFWRRDVVVLAALRAKHGRKVGRRAGSGRTAREASKPKKA